jgi:hypothetical protein
MSPRKKFTKQFLGGALPAQPREKVEKLFQRSVLSWEATETCRQLRSTLASTNLPFEVRKVVGFACGPISSTPGDPLTCRSLFQHALILTISDVLRQKMGNSDSIMCYAQDPAYTDVDKSVLSGAGITVLDNPEAFLIVDESTAVFSCAPNVPVKQIVSDLTQPAIMIWDRIKRDAACTDGKEVVVT